MSDEVDVGRSSVLECFVFCRSLCVRVMEAHPAPLFGGPGKAVEIDESAFAKRKYNRGRMLRILNLFLRILTLTQWVLGGVERNSEDYFLIVVQDRSANKLLATTHRKSRRATDSIE